MRLTSICLFLSCAFLFLLFPSVFFLCPTNDLQRQLRGGFEVWRCKVTSFFLCSQYFFLFLMVPLLRNHFHTPVSVRFPFFYVVTTPQNGVFNNRNSSASLQSWVVITPQNGVFNNDLCLSSVIDYVVITPQNGVFNNSLLDKQVDDVVVITPQNGVFNNHQRGNNFL